ncbi:GntR family L-lactate dehydrogenase operon transcriptional regulator [Pseudonocardia kunmingensis]|uniref:GntR family L-lactate dehydrogenase operon transcriptional regulator n=1 Tax=Pseudonocardia kunmingensis TaxID=630975 RepID=A0A543DQU8_9PSEU|nr:GntR family L-lactate dehydrogenase operon transcriptional regulator [Pseudonocardia kunmingensis]
MMNHDVEGQGSAVNGEPTTAGAELGGDAEALLLVLHRADEPIGARVARRLLEEAGRELSEASVSRVLAKLDAAGMTESVGRKGRVLTDVGRRFTTSSLLSRHRHEQFTRALDLRSVQEVLDWLRARRALETEIARLAAERAHQTEIDALEAALADHERQLDRGADPTPAGMHFHQLIIGAAKSPLFEALTGSLYTPALAPVERALDVITGGRGTIGHSPAEHAVILAAIKDHDPDAASEAMHSHLDRLIKEVEEFSVSSMASMLPNLLTVLAGA